MTVIYNGMHSYPHLSGTQYTGELFFLVKPERDCMQFRRNGHTKDGIYLINPGSVHPFPVYCDMTIDGGGLFINNF